MSGYIYFLSNDSMPGIYKIGMTKRNPEKRLKEANRGNTFNPPTDYKIEFTKYVDNVRDKETYIHNLLEERGKRINNRREFFKLNDEEFKNLIKELEFPITHSTRFILNKNHDINKYLKLNQKIVFSNQCYGIYKGNNKVLHKENEIDIYEFCMKCSGLYAENIGLICSYSPSFDSLNILDVFLYLYRYIEYCIHHNARDLEIENTIMNTPKNSYLYALCVIMNKWKQGEKYIKKDSYYSYLYARDVIRGRWEEGEKYIKKDKNCYEEYQKFIRRK